MKGELQVVMTRSRPPLSWWVEKLGIQDIPGKNDLFAPCPAHNDNGPSLHLTKKAHGDVVVHCFAGCTYEAILEAVDSGVRVKARVVASKGETKPATDLPALVWWARYTNVPEEVWTQLGVAEADDYLAFTFQDSPYVKGRLKGTKTFKWTPAGGKPPPLWPIPRKELLDAETVWFTEGESDCGVLRYLGYAAFALAKGADTKIPRGYVKGFHAFGVKRIICTFDADEAGDKGYAELKKQIGKEFSLVRFPVENLIAPFSQETDFRDLLARLGEDALKVKVQEIVGGFPGGGRELDYPSLVDDLQETKTEWLWSGMIPKNNITLFRGDAKVGKSTFLFALFNRMREGGTLGGRTVAQGRVVLVSEESPNTLKPKADIHGPLSNVFRVAHSPNLSWEEIIKAGVSQAESVGAGTLVVDTFASFAKFESGEENDAAATFERLNVLSLFKHKLSIILVHHNSKQGKTRGSSAIDAHVDGILSVTKGQGVHRNFESTNRYESARAVLSVDPKTGHEAVVVSKREREEKEEDRNLTEEVMALVSSHPNIDKDQIAKELSISPAHLRAILSRLTAKSKLIKVGESSYKTQELHSPPAPPEKTQ